jgi:hypothetical protein
VGTPGRLLRADDHLEYEHSGYGSSVLRAQMAKGLEPTIYRASPRPLVRKDSIISLILSLYGPMLFFPAIVTAATAPRCRLREKSPGRSGGR